MPFAPRKKESPLFPWDKLLLIINQLQIKFRTKEDDKPQRDKELVQLHEIVVQSASRTGNMQLLPDPGMVFMRGIGTDVKQNGLLLGIQPEESQVAILLFGGGDAGGIQHAR